MHEWVERRQEYVDEFLRLDGLGDIDGEAVCATCAILPGLYKCKDCFGGSLHCGACTVHIHRVLPLHRILVGSSKSTRRPFKAHAFIAMVWYLLSRYKLTRSRPQSPSWSRRRDLPKSPVHSGWLHGG